MAGFSTYLAQKLIDITLRQQPYTPPAGLYLALFTSDPTDNNVTANEVTGAWYVRQATGAWAAVTGTGNSTSNNNQIQYPAVSGSPVTVPYWGVYDALSGGNLLYSGALAVAKVLNVGDIMVVAPGQLVIELD